MSRSQKIIVTTAYMECPMCPSTYIGTTATGHTVYARYRFGSLSVRLDPRNPAPYGGAWGLTLMEAHLGEPDDGHMDYAEMREHSKNLVSWPAELSPRPINDDDCMEI